MVQKQASRSPVAMLAADASRQAERWPMLRGVAQRLFTYGGLAYAFIFLGMQIAPPRIPVASAATPVPDVARMLPALPEDPIPLSRRGGGRGVGCLVAQRRVTSLISQRHIQICQFF